ncbi:hypothetical protein EOA32_03180 [Mesorhizobium sp. M1A.F.Ca.ET.072.01.1.1]|uniref:hypothetical protein n=1 Tax=Mesorhizobium sp. M1A.F.Ca.ET.072.01.1.1 TaxID=2496753 RepID=UPI000FD4E403|nr:hypothetical protein [Mesorhizobium sp. M1A.F.Ca.ET.072.01.1.1]RUW55039.1 hypothetical protein EOA32_03180 [Mesorhizobium sp. M1A.F.Ca.ET.072.01.1.1]TIV04725.1 MAG: hypothetical protein E5W04_02235 [Mesorhizobium sp.]
MPNLGFGLTAGGVPALRIAFDNATDLVNESASNVGKFKFDSLNGTKLSYVYDIGEKGSYDSRYASGGGWNTNYWFFTGQGDWESPYTATNIGTTSKALIIWLTSGTGTQTKYVYKEWFPFGYMPIMEWRIIDPALAANTYTGPIINYSAFATSNGYVESFSGQRSLTAAHIDSNLYGSSGTREAYTQQVKSSSPNTTSRYLTSVFQLPARDDAMPDYSGAPSSGQQVLLLNPTTARLALPGRDVTDANLDHYIFHEDKIPAKIMAAGDVNVAASGTANIACPLPITAFTYMDFMIRRQTDTEFWNPPYFDSIASDKSLQFTYLVDVANQRITITNLKATAVTIRYIIFADSEQAPTTGGKKVLYKGNDGTRDFVQIKRPGSSDPAPNLNDIIVDTRLAYVPILAQGFLSWTSDFPTVVTSPNQFKGERMATVNVTNPSPKLKLFVKQGVVFDTRTTPTACRWGYHKVFTDASGWTGRCSADSTWAMVHSDESAVDFYMAGGNPQTANNAGGTTYNQYWDGSNHQSTALGLRYYIIGIPSSL